MPVKIIGPPNFTLQGRCSGWSGTDITKSYWNLNFLKSLFYRSCPQCGVRSIRIGKLYLKEVGCRSCHSIFSVHIFTKLVSAVFVFVGIRLTFVLIPTIGIIGSILFCYLLVIVVEYLLFRYSPLKTRSKKEARVRIDTVKSE